MLENRLNLNNATITVAANPIPPLFYGESNTTTREWVPIHGLDVSFLNTLGKYFNFKWRIDHCNDNWGHPSSNCSWDGLIGKVASKTSDMAIGAVWINAERLNVVDFSIPTTISRLTFATLEAQRQALPIDKGVLALPFDRNTWLSLIIAFSLLLIVDKIFQFVTKTKADLVLQSFAGFKQKDSQQNGSKSLAVGILVEIRWYSSLILCAAYGGNLLSFLTFNDEAVNIDTILDLNDLIIQNRVIPLLLNSSENMQMLKLNHESAIFKAISEKMYFGKNYKQGFNMLSKKTRDKRRIYALIGPYYVLDAWARILKGRLFFHISDTHESAFYDDFFGIAFPKNSTWKKHFDRFIRLASEGSLFDYWFNNEMEKLSKFGRDITVEVNYGQKIKENYNNKYAYNVLKIEQIDDPFILLMYVYIVSIFGFFLEINMLFSKINCF